MNFGVFRGQTKRFGRDSRIRTYDLYVPNVALYQTELYPELLKIRPSKLCILACDYLLKSASVRRF